MVLWLTFSQDLLLLSEVKYFIFLVFKIFLQLKSSLLFGWEFILLLPVILWLLHCWLNEFGIEALVLYYDIIISSVWTYWSLQRRWLLNRIFCLIICGLRFFPKWRSLIVLNWCTLNHGLWFRSLAWNLLLLVTWTFWIIINRPLPFRRLFGFRNSLSGISYVFTKRNNERTTAC